MNVSKSFMLKEMVIGLVRKRRNDMYILLFICDFSFCLFLILSNHKFIIICTCAGGHGIFESKWQQ